MAHTGSQAVDHRPQRRGAGEFGQVLPFRRPGQPTGETAGEIPIDAEQDDDLARYEQEPEEVVDYRQRMLMNIIALVVTALLVGTGVWLADTISTMQRDQDCFMQGRVNCAPLEPMSAVGQ